MTYFWGAVVVLTLLALAIVWLHFIRMQRQQGPLENANSGVRQDTNIALYKEHLAELEQDLASNALDQESFDELKDELDRTLLDDSSAEPVHSSPAKRSAVGFIWALVLSLFIGLFSVVFYNQHGAHEQLAQTPIAINSWEIKEKVAEMRAQSAHQSDGFDIVAELKRLRNEVEKNPENSDAWFMIGQILMEVGEYSAALVAIDKVIGIEGELPELLATKAQTLYYLDEQELTPRVQSLVDKVLTLDPHESGVLVLLGMDAYFHNRFQQAIDYWQHVVDDGREGVNIDALQNAINDARRQLLSGGSEVTAEPQVPVGPTLTANISLSDELIESMEEDKVVFVYAVSAEGSRVPVAAVKLMASDLPVQVTLSDANAMSPAASLSKTEKVNLIAVMSQTGQPGLQPGDFKAQVDNLPHDHEQVINLVIATKVL